MQYEELFADRKRIGSNIEAIMKDRKCTKVTLSKEIKVSRPTLDAILRGDIHNAGKYDEYIRRLLAYMQISDTVLDNYKYLPAVDRMRCTSVDKEEVQAALEGEDIPVLKGDVNQLKAGYMKLKEQGIKIFAMAYVPGVENLLAEISSTESDITVGVANVTDKHIASVMVECGAKFLIAPCLIEEIGTFCRARDVFCMMGATTLTEILAASQKGGDIVCLYPFESVAPATLQAIEVMAEMPKMAAFALKEKAADFDGFAKVFYV